MTHLSWVAYTALLIVSLSETRQWSMWLDSLVFCDCGFCLPALSQHLPFYQRFSDLECGVSHHGPRSWPWTWGTSFWPLTAHCSSAGQPPLIHSSATQHVTGDQWRNNSRKNEEMEPKQKQHPVVDVTGDGSKVWCCKEQYCIGTWNIRSRNQGKLEVVKQEMVRVNVDILGISWLKWTGMSEFNSSDHHIYYCGQESLRRSGVNKRVWNAVLWCNLKNARMISVHFQGKPFTIMVIQV